MLGSNFLQEVQDLKNLQFYFNLPLKKKENYKKNVKKNIFFTYNSYIFFKVSSPVKEVILFIPKSKILKFIFLLNNLIRFH